MRTLALLLASTLISQVQEIPEVEGKTLPSVPGPLTDHAQDPSRGLQPRDLEVKLRHQARRTSSIPAIAVPKGSIAILDRISDPAGWRAYRVDVPAKGVLHARITATHEAWFLVRTVNKWGQLESGMLQNRIPTGNPEATYKNPKDEVSTVFFVVDTTELSMQGEAFKITFRAK